MQSVEKDCGLNGCGKLDLSMLKSAHPLFHFVKREYSIVYILNQKTGTLLQRPPLLLNLWAPLEFWQRMMGVTTTTWLSQEAESTTKCQVMHNSDSSLSVFQIDALFNRMSLKLSIWFKNTVFHTSETNKHTELAKTLSFDKLTLYYGGK